MPCVDRCRHVNLPMRGDRVLVEAWGRAIPHDWVDTDWRQDGSRDDEGYVERLPMVRAVMNAGLVDEIRENLRQR